MSEPRRTTVPGIGRRLSCCVYGDMRQPRAVMVSEKPGSWGESIEALSRRGWSVVAIDHPGTGWDETLDDLTRALKFLPGTEAVVGDGVVGAALAVVAVEQKVDVKRAVVVDPPSDLAATPRWEAASQILGDRLDLVGSIADVELPETTWR